jgi:hypothetical protein
MDQRQRRFVITPHTLLEAVSPAHTHTSNRQPHTHSPPQPPKSSMSAPVPVDSSSSSPASSSAPTITAANVKIPATLSLYRWWKNDGKSKSALAERGSLPYRAKKRFMHRMKLRGVVHDDRPNGVPHVTIIVDGWRDRDGAFQTASQHQFVLSRESLRVNSDHAAIHLGLDMPSKEDIHMTLLFKDRFRADHEEAARAVWDQVLVSLVEEPERPEDSILSPYEVIIDEETAVAAGNSGPAADGRKDKRSRKSGGRRGGGGADASAAAPAESEVSTPSDSEDEQVAAGSTESQGRRGGGRRGKKKTRVSMEELNDKLDLVLANQAKMMAGK